MCISLEEMQCRCWSERNRTVGTGLEVEKLLLSELRILHSSVSLSAAPSQSLRKKETSGAEDGPCYLAITNRATNKRIIKIAPTAQPTAMPTMAPDHAANSDTKVPQPFFLTLTGR